ncbi:hypothetical protein D3C72_2375030 [compost metagenome]
MGHDEFGSDGLQGFAGAGRLSFEQLSQAIRQCRAWQHAVNGYAAAGHTFGQATRQRQLRRLGYAVMNHIGRDISG